MDISEASFTDCLQNTTTEGQLCFFKSEDKIYFGCKLKGMHTVNSYNDSSLCQLGLGLNVTVKEALPWTWSMSYRSLEQTYSCHCQPPFSGKYFYELDECPCKSCKKKKNGSGSNTTEKLNNQGYEYICHPPFT
ncbi:hypothetical protein FD754_016517, partial [Muntiacus muntjak]